MYYSQPRPQSPGRPLQFNDPSAPWSRLQHPILSQPGGGPQPQQGQVVGVPPQSPGYGLVQYTNGTTHHHNPNIPPHHHHHQSLNSFPLTHYQSPANTHAQPHRQTSSPPPPPASAQIPKHWQAQLDHADACRKAGSPHSRARTAASNTRSTAKSVIPITDPNRVTPKLTNGVVNGHGKDGSVSEIASEAGGTEDHPSSTVAPVSSPAPPRPTVPRKSESTWSALDLGGMRLKNLAPALFKFNYLTTLYLNHNQLTHVTPSISQLRHLTVLDLSSNQLDTIPPELGMCTSLEHLWLFDNNIEILPPEIGSLHQLKMLGVEGNPLQPALASIIQTQGTPALIAYLRDSCPVPMPPPERVWKVLQSEAERKLQDADPNSETFTLLTYNILCEKAATSTMYGYTPSWALAWNYRKELILTEIINYQADFLCLQEVEVAQYEDYFSPNLSREEYEGIFSPRGRARNMADSERRSVDGCAIFYKSTKYRLVKQSTIDFAQVAIQREDFTKNNDMFDRVLARDHIAVVALLENRQTGSRLIVANAHVYWDHAFRDVKLVQTGILMDSLKEIADWFAKYPPRPPPSTNGDSSDESRKSRASDPVYSEGKDIPLIVCGDYNSIPGSGVYDFLSEGKVPSNHPDFMDYVYGKFTADGLKHDFGLRSAYAGIGERPMTNYTPTFEGVIDYIFYTTSNLSVNAVLGEVDPEYLSKVVGFPNAHFPSDHVCVVSEFRLKKEASSGSRPPLLPPVFPS